jgi:SAM-dependent methyltransferase
LGATNKRVLNIGIGPGAIEEMLLSRRWHVAALDPDDAAVARLRQKGVLAVVGYSHALPFGPASFDVVVASEVLEHLSDEQRGLTVKELWRVLVPGGHLVGTVPYRENLGDNEVVCPSCGVVFHRWGHAVSFDERALQRELRSHFDVLHSGPRCFVDWNASRSPRLLLKATVKAALGRLGESVVSPSLYFVARRRAD